MKKKITLIASAVAIFLIIYIFALPLRTWADDAVPNTEPTLEEFFTYDGITYEVIDNNSHVKITRVDPSVTPAGLEAFYAEMKSANTPVTEIAGNENGVGAFYGWGWGATPPDNSAQGSPKDYLPLPDTLTVIGEEAFGFVRVKTMTLPVSLADSVINHKIFFSAEIDELFFEYSATKNWTLTYASFEEAWIKSLYLPNNINSIQTDTLTFGTSYKTGQKEYVDIKTYLDAPQAVKDYISLIIAAEHLKVSYLMPFDLQPAYYVKNAPFSYQFPAQAKDKDTTYTYADESGALATCGLTISASGELYGAPNFDGEKTFDITITPLNGNAASFKLTLTISAGNTNSGGNNNSNNNNSNNNNNNHANNTVTPTPEAVTPVDLPNADIAIPANTNSPNARRNTNSANADNLGDTAKDADANTNENNLSNVNNDANPADGEAMPEKVLQTLHTEYADGTDFTYRIDMPLSEFLRIDIDGEELTRDVDYSVKEGSTIITLPAQRMEQIALGEHRMNAHFTGGVVEVFFVKSSTSEPVVRLVDTQNNSFTITVFAVTGAIILMAAVGALIFIKKRVQQ